MSAEIVATKLEVFKEAIFADDSLGNWIVENGTLERTTSDVLTLTYSDEIRYLGVEVSARIKTREFLGSDYNLTVKINSLTTDYGEIYVGNPTGTSWYLLGQMSSPGTQTFTNLPSVTIGQVRLKTAPSVGNVEWDYVVIHKGAMSVEKLNSFNLRLEKAGGLNILEAQFTIPEEVSINIGDHVKFYVANRGESFKKLLAGRISNIEEFIRERLKEIRITAVSGTHLIDNIHSYKEGSYSRDTLITDWLNDLESKSLMDTHYQSIGGSIAIREIKNAYFLDSLKNISEKNISYTIAPNGDFLWVYHPAYYSTPLETIGNVLDYEYIQDDKELRNTITLGANVAIEKDDSYDGWTDSLTGWQCHKRIGATWTTANISLSSLRVSGSYSIQGDWDIPVNELWIVLDLKKTLDLSRGGALHFDFTGLVERGVISIPILTQQSVELNVYLMNTFHSTPPTDNYARARMAWPGGYDDYTGNVDWTEKKIRVGRLWGNWISSNFTWESVNCIGISINPKDRGEDITSRIKVLIDKLYFGGLYYEYTYQDSESVSKYGKRPLVYSKSLSYMSTKAQLQALAKRLIEPRKAPIKGYRSITTDEILDTLPGRAITVPSTLDYPGNYYVDNIVYQLENFELKTVLTLSTSPMIEPVRSKEELLTSFNNRLVKQLGEIEEIKSTLSKVPREIELYGAPTHKSYIDFGNTGFDWSSLAKGIGGLATTAIRQALGAGSAIWDNMISALGLAKGNELIEANSVYAEQIAASSITTDHLRSNIVFAKHITASAIDTQHLRSKIIFAEHITSSAIETDHLRSNIINANHITVSAVEADHIRSNIIEGRHLRTDTAVITTSAQIKKAIIQDLHIGQEQIKFAKTETEFPWLTWGDKATFTVNFESLDGIEKTVSGAGNYLLRKNDLIIYFTDAGTVELAAYPVLPKEFKWRSKYLGRMDSIPGAIFSYLGIMSSSKTRKLALTTERPIDLEFGRTEVDYPYHDLGRCVAGEETMFSTYSEGGWFWGGPICFKPNKDIYWISSLKYTPTDGVREIYTKFHTGISYVLYPGERLGWGSLFYDGTTWKMFYSPISSVLKFDLSLHHTISVYIDVLLDTANKSLAFWVDGPGNSFMRLEDYPWYIWFKDANRSRKYLVGNLDNKLHGYEFIREPGSPLDTLSVSCFNTTYSWQLDFDEDARDLYIYVNDLVGTKPRLRVRFWTSQVDWE